MVAWLELPISLLRCAAIPKEYAFETSVRSATSILVHLGRLAVAIAYTKRLGRATLGSTFRSTKVWLNPTRCARF